MMRSAIGVPWSPRPTKPTCKLRAVMSRRHSSRRRPCWPEELAVIPGDHAFGVDLHEHSPVRCSAELLECCALRGALVSLVHGNGELEELLGVVEKLCSTDHRYS